MEHIGKDDRARKIEGIAYNKPAKLSPLTIGSINVKGHVIITRPKEDERDEQRNNEHRPTEIGPFLGNGIIALDRQPIQYSCSPAGPTTKSPSKEKRAEDLSHRIMDENTSESTPRKKVGKIKNILFDLKIFVLNHSKKDHEC